MSDSERLAAIERFGEFLAKAAEDETIEATIVWPETHQPHFTDRQLSTIEAILAYATPIKADLLAFIGATRGAYIIKNVDTALAATIDATPKAWQTILASRQLATAEATVAHWHYLDHEQKFRFTVIKPERGGQNIGVQASSLGLP